MPARSPVAALQARLLDRGAAQLEQQLVGAHVLRAALAPNALERAILDREGEHLRAHIDQAAAASLQLNANEHLFRGAAGQALAEELRAEIAAAGDTDPGDL